MPFGTSKIKEAVSSRFDHTIKPNRTAVKMAEKRIKSPAGVKRTQIPQDPVADIMKSAKHIVKAPVKKATGFFRNLFKTTPAQQKLTEEDLINAESQLGATLFGPVPKGHRREFFRFQHNVWIYHEAWTKDGKNLESTITYEVRENGVYKLPLGGQYTKLQGAELENFRKAVREYLKIIKQRLY